MAPSDLSPAERIAQLRREIDRHNYLYYVEAAPVISDREFDKLMAELSDLERKHPELVTPDSPTQRVGGAPIPGFQPVTHRIPMLSIENSYDEADLRKFDADVRKALGPRAVVEYTAELKIDGISLAVTYEKGRLAYAATRGNGTVGDDVTHIVRTIRAIPLRLATDTPPPLFEARGEVYMTRAELTRINRLIEESNARPGAKRQEPYKNTRNLTAGTFRLLDPKECAKRRMQFAAYGVGVVEGLTVRTQVELLELLRRLGFPVDPHTRLCRSIDEVLAYCREWRLRRKELPFDTDGVVVKVNDLAQREILGATAKVPRWMRAFKYEPEQAVTKLAAVDFHVGKFGELTPVARFDPPVQLAGTTVTHASLHNAAWVAERDVRIGDTVVVEKKGEIIPQVVDVITADRTGSERVITWPENCPGCGGPVVRVETASSYNYQCGNPEACAGGLARRIEGFARKSCMDIDGLGREVARQLVESGLVKSIPDLYRLTKEQLLTLEKFGEVRASKLLAAIAASKDRGLARLLPALGIYMVGQEMAEALVEQFPSLDAILAARPEDLARVRGWGPERVRYLRAFFDSEAGRRLVAELKELGLKLTHDPRPTDQAGGRPLAGKTVVVTGTLKNFDRAGIEAAIKRYGGKPAGSVSKNTDFVLVGDKPGSKLEDARRLGIPTLTEDEFLRLVGEPAAPADPERSKR